MDEPLRYYFDEHMHHHVTTQLRARGIDVLAAREAGRANRGVNDVDQLRYATERSRVLVTEDSDFVALSAMYQPHPGIVYFPIRLAIGPCVEYLELLALTTTPDEMRDTLLYGRW